MDQIREFLNQFTGSDSMLFIVIGVCILLLILIIIVTFFSRKKVKLMQNEAETLYTSIKSISLPFKMNKAESLARVNTTIKEAVEKSRVQFESVQECLKECSSELGEIDDLIYVHKTKAAKVQLVSLIEKLHGCESEANTLNAVLDSILEQQSTQREQIIRLQNRFRVNKGVIASNREIYNSGIEVLEDRVLTIEKMFSTFEEWMYASEFSKAAKQQEEISEAIDELELLMKEYPALYEEAKLTLPKAIDETSYVYSQARNKGVYLEHLEVSKNLEIISGTLKDDLNQLSEGRVDHIMDSLLESRKRLTQLKEQVIHEEKAYDELRSNVQFLYDQIDHLEKQRIMLKELYEKKKERFGLNDMSVQLEMIDQEVKKLFEDRETLKGCILEKTIPATTLLLSYKDLSADTNEVCDRFEKIKEQLESACSDEIRAQKQLLKLQLILNEIHVKMNKKRLPSVSMTYSDDYHKAEMMVADIVHILNVSPLDIDVLNVKIKESIDFIYTLYNSVNNLVGMATMVENTIVFGNRYRSTNAEIDSELTRAELCFRNGQYTKALKIAISAIEKIHPGSYEKLLRKSQGV
ncbi:septation ring formation regulator EzrA [Traorella massiliensis]|uniref:septation ring formation regulator EzrA n=1 Tax=Traorella massiliensis TaxID=1903263 RepID=UPI0008F80BD8|nr:septation ring formation regulator EzrA [Traorella massiliensis]